jgi:NAD-dependent DNA ligase
LELQKWNATKVDLVLTDKESSDSVQIEQLVHFFEKCGIENFSSKTIEAFYNAGYTTVLKIVSMSKNTIAKMEGMGPRKADIILEQFEKLQAVPMNMLMYATSVFGPNYGSRKLAAIIDKYKETTLSRWAGKTVKQVAQEISQLNGFSFETGLQFAKGINPFVQFLKTHKQYIKGVWPKAQRKTSNALSGVTVVMTGFRDSDLEKKIGANGGSVASSVSSKVTHLLVADEDTSSLKAQKARDLGIKIMTAEKFIKHFKL